MKLCDLISVVESSEVYVYINPSSLNNFESFLVLKIDIYNVAAGKLCLFYPDQSNYLLYKNHNVVSFIYGKLGICVYVEESSHGKV